MDEPYYNLMYAADFYKISHKAQYPENITKVHSVLVARGAKYNDMISKDEFMWFGVEIFIYKLEEFSDWFFNMEAIELNEVLDEYQDFLETRLNSPQSVEHWITLWTLGSLPIKIHSVEERKPQKFQVPLLTIENDVSGFGWLVTFIETTMLANVWGVTTAANRAWHIRSTIESFMIDHTDEEKGAIDFMGHDFSYRGLMGDEATTLAGCGHLSQFKGSDTIPAARMMEEVYGEVTGFSVPATEHSVMCAGGEENELQTYERILDIYPTGIVSIVSDTWDYFGVLRNTLSTLKPRIMARDGKVVIRPDSGDPVKIICGNDEADGDEYLGSLEVLGEVFGATLDSTGLLLLDSHVGLIYGDGMNQETIFKMLSEMVERGWSPLNIVFGIGAYTYQYMTRDELGFAFKATSVLKDDVWTPIQKDPKTDKGKKSLTGRFTGGDLERVY